MLLSIVYFALGRLLRVVAPSARGDLARDVELLVLRHQVKVLSRSARRPPLRRRDRMLLAAASRILPRERWKAFVVTPPDPASLAPGTGSADVDLRPSGPGRPPLGWDTVELIVRPAKENPRLGYLRIRGELLKLGVRVSHVHPNGPPSEPSGPGPTPEGSLVERVSPGPGQ